MTEKIARRGIKTPESYEPDILEKITAEQVMKENGVIISEDNNIGEITNWLENEPDYNSNYFIVSDPGGCYKGIISASNLFSKHHNAATMVGTLIKRQPVSIKVGSSLRQAIELMAKENLDVLPVLARESNNVSGILSYKDIISGYKKDMDHHQAKNAHISLKRRGLKILLHGQKIISLRK